MYIFQDFKGNMLRSIYGILLGTQVRAVFLYRLSSWCYHHKLKPLSTIFWSLNVALHSCDIARESTIGSGLKLVHTVGIVIGPIKAGNNLTLFQNTTIGYGGSSKENRNHAELGNDIIMYSGSVVAGNISVGDKAVIGANSVVLKDVPPYSTSVGIPAKTILKN